MSRLYASCTVLVAALVTGCADQPPENPVVVPQIMARCGPAARLVTNACTQLGPDDGCTNVADVCVALCDQRTSCTTVGGLRVLNGWPTAPDGYCVECTAP